MILAIDQGTTGTTCLVVDAELTVRGRAYAPLPQHFPRPGWVEHDPDEIWAGVVAATEGALADARLRPSDLDALGITNQRETTLLWERRTGRPVARAIVWQDRRTAARCAALESEAAHIADVTGLVLDPYFSATKLAWLLEEGGLGERAAAGELLCGTVDSWLVWRLTGGRVHATDHTNASRTMLYDTRRLAWSEELCARFRIPLAMLPEVRPSAGDFGATVAGLFGRAIPITGVAGDQQAALFGQGCWGPAAGRPC